MMMTLPKRLLIQPVLRRSFASQTGEKIVVLGSGWAGFQLILNASSDLNLTMISPRNHFVFTPLLPSASVGTLEARCIQEPIRTVLSKNGTFIQAKARSLNTTDKVVVCESMDKKKFQVKYDKLVIAVGVKTNTFGISSVKQFVHAEDSIFFLKHLKHAKGIRSHIIDCFEKASLPVISEPEKKQLLTFVVVGGGPTSCEFTAELHDFVKQDVKRLYSDLLPFVQLTVVEAGPVLLGPFDQALQKYALGLMEKRDIDVRLQTAVTGVEEFHSDSYVFQPKRALLSDGSKLEFGTMVWSAGVAPRTFSETLDVPKDERTKRILVDEFLRVKGHEGSIWAVGDAAVNEKGAPLPQLAQVARQQGIYLAKVFNRTQGESEKPFQFFSLGSMAFMGEMKAVYDGSTAGPLRDPKDGEENKKNWMPPALRGFSALLLWRFAYFGRQTSITNKILIPMHWFKTFFFGRDTSRY